MISFEAKFKIVTPLFMSGADRELAELRPASIKGVLRFWWRALALSKYDFSLREVREKEFNLFGSSSHGQSRVHLSLVRSKESEKRFRSGTLIKDHSGNIIGQGTRYLGYGVLQSYDRKDKSGKIIERLVLSSRSYLDASLEGILRLDIRSATEDTNSEDAIDEVDLLENSILAMGLLGGIGSRSRRGFGSFNLLDLKKEGELIYSAKEENYFSSLEKLFREYAKGTQIPEYTALSQDSCLYLLKTGKDPLNLLDDVGQEMQMYRSWGLRDTSGRYMVGNKPSEQNFKDDHDNMYDAIFASAREHPRRVAFGLPHNYHFTGANRNISVLSENYERRASPLFLHIHELSNEKYAAMALILPAMFLPDKERIRIQRDDGNIQLLDLQKNWRKVLTDFVEGDVCNHAGKKRFPEHKVVWPKAEEVSA